MSRTVPRPRNGPLPAAPQRRGTAMAVALALLGSLWAAFLLPPQVVAWDGEAAPAWGERLADAAPYGWIRQAGGGVDDYVLFGALVAPSFLLIGLALLPVGRVAGRWTTALAWLTLLGAPAVLVSYPASGWEGPWSVLWGLEIPLLLAMGLCGIVAGVRAYRRRRLPGWACFLLGATVLVLGVSTGVFTYFPHGSLVGYGIEVAVLVSVVRRR